MKKLFFGLLVLLLSGNFAQAVESLTPESFVDIEIQVRSLSNEELKAKIDNKDMAVKYKAAIKAVYKMNNTTPSSHVKFANKNKKTIKKWLHENPVEADKLEQLTVEFNHLLSQMD